VRLLAVREQCGPLAHQRDPAPEQVAGRPHLRGLDVRLGAHPTAEEASDLLGVDRVMFRFAAMDRLPRQCMSQHAGHAGAGTEVRPPIPGEEACDTDDEVLTRGRNGLEKRVRPCLHMPVDQYLSIVVQDADVHGAGMEVNAAVKFVLCVVEAHEVSSSSA